MRAGDDPRISVRCAARGRKMIVAGEYADPFEPATEVADAIADLLHYATTFYEGDVEELIGSALRYFRDEEWHPKEIGDAR